MALGAGVVARVRRTIEERGLLAPGVRVLAACSGGPDSGGMLVALARLAPQLGFALEAASVDHRLRPGGAADVAVAQAQASALGVRCHPLAVTVTGRGSLQARAREARYAALARCARAIGAQRIAVAHTREDQAETVLARLLRGSGVRGLGGIDPSRADGVIRPLIDCARADVHALAGRELSVLALDPSNADSRFQRARLRSDVLPALERESPAVVDQLAELADEARDLLEIVSPMVGSLLARAVQANETIAVSALIEAPGAVRRLALAAWVEGATGVRPGRAQLEQAERLLGRGGEVWLARGLSLHATATHARILRGASPRRRARGR